MSKSKRTGGVNVLKPLKDRFTQAELKRRALKLQRRAARRIKESSNES